MCYLDAQDAVTTGTRLPGVTVDDTQVGYAPAEMSVRQQQAAGSSKTMKSQGRQLQQQQQQQQQAVPGSSESPKLCRTEN